MALYKMIRASKIKEGQLIQYAGVYILKAEEMGLKPDCYFVEVDEEDER